MYKNNSFEFWSDCSASSLMRSTLRSWIGVRDCKLRFSISQKKSISQTAQRWDRSHFLENLSGYETDCAMIGSSDWPFTRAISVAGEAGMRIVGTYGSARNLGSTPDALVSILNRFKVVSYLFLSQSSRSLHCSLHCRLQRCQADSKSRSLKLMQNK